MTIEEAEAEPIMIVFTREEAEAILNAARRHSHESNMVEKWHLILDSAIEKVDGALR